MIKDEEEHVELKVVRKINYGTTKRDDQTKQRSSAVANRPDSTYNKNAWVTNNGECPLVGAGPREVLAF
ncbi:hypothetical protein DOY81_007518 [Sarcophaga bullata]|nr:hypothetical protein DOY81_007518 [Sarcophaga bullata]